MSILLGEGSGASWTLVPGPRISTDAGPVAVAVGNILGNGTQDLAVANQQADNVQVFTSVGSGFFSQTATTYPVGQAPDGLFLGDFSGSGTQIATLNGGSNSISLINPSTGGVTQTIPTGGVLPTSGFAGDFNGNGFSDLVVGNTADGRIALFTGGAAGFELEPEHHQRRGAEPDVAELRRGVRRRAQLLRRHRRPRGGLAAGLQPEPAARLRYRRPYRRGRCPGRRGSHPARCWPPRRPACSSRSDCCWARAARCST